MLLTEQDQPVSNSESSDYDMLCFSDDFLNDLPGPYTDEDSDYASYQEPEHQSESWQRSSSSRNIPSTKKDTIPPPPFDTPPKLKTVEYVMKSFPGKDLASLRRLTTALAREAIFGREEMMSRSITGRQKTERLDQDKLDYIKTLVHSRVPQQSNTEFESTWKWCKQSLSKSCQTLRTSAKKKCF